MDCFIKKIFLNNADESVHKQFVRFGKGDYKGRAALSLWKTGKIKLGGSYEHANDFVNLAAEFGGGKASGVVLSKQQISSILSESIIKGNSETKKGGLFFENNIEEQNLTGEQIKKLVENSYAALLDIEGFGFSLKIKKKLPKPGKSEELKIDDKFCILEADLKFLPEIKEAFFWDIPDAKKAKASHEYIITELITPKGEKDFEQIRLKTRRKGKIRRKLDIDGQTQTREFEFEA